MKVTIDQQYMDDEKLTKEAQKLLKREVEGHLVMIVSQAGIIENRERSENSDREITGRHISDAAIICGHGLRKNKITKKVIWLRIFQLGGSLIIGVGASNFTTWWGIALAFIGFVIAVISYVLELEDSR